MWTNKHGAISMFWRTEQSQPGQGQARRCQAGELACYKRATDVPQKGAVACFSTRRAPSSPHHACGLNGALFLHFCGPLAVAQAGRLVGVLEREKACGTLQRGGISSKGLEALLWLSEGGCFKKSNFSNRLWGRGWRPRIPWGCELQKGVTEK